MAPRSCEPCRALEEVPGNTPGYAHLAVSLRLLQARVWTAPAHRAAQPSHAEGQQPTRKSLSFNKLMVGTCEPLTCHCATALRACCPGCGACPLWASVSLCGRDTGSNFGRAVGSLSVLGALDLGHLNCVPAVVASKKLTGELGCLLKLAPVVQRSLH